MKIREGQSFFELHYDEGESGLATGSNAIDENGGRGEDVRNLGQVATPREIADVMAKWIVTPGVTEVIDPAAGLGHLLHACTRAAPAIQCVGIESDRSVYEAAKSTAPKGTRLVLADYLRRPPGSHRAIIANPPYVKSQRMALSESEWMAFDEMFDTRLGRQTNLYALFILKIWQDLAPGGRAAIIVPAEFLNANFGVAIKERLLVMKPAGLAVFSPEVNVFEKTLTTSAVLFLEKTSGNREFSGACVHNSFELAAFVGYLTGDRAAGCRVLNLGEVSPSSKWLNLILSPESQTEASHGETKLGKFYGCSRGIATGANDFFTLRAQEIQDWNLSLNDFDLCVTKASDLKGWTVDARLSESLRENGKRCFLLNPRKQSPAMDAYLEHGMSLAVHTRHLPSKRPVWYLPERRPVPAILAPVFTRGRVRFILNAAGLRCLTCFHGLAPKPGFEHLTPLVWLYLNSREGQRAFRKVNRFYGNGLNKLEPKDVEEMPVPDFSNIDPATAGALISQLGGPAAVLSAEEPWFDRGVDLLLESVS